MSLFIINSYIFAIHHTQRTVKRKPSPLQYLIQALVVLATSPSIITRCPRRKILYRDKINRGTVAHRGELCVPGLSSRDRGGSSLAGGKRWRLQNRGLRGSFKTPRKHGPIKGYGPLGKRENSAAYAGVPVRLVIGRGAGPIRAGSPDRVIFSRHWSLNAYKSPVSVVDSAFH